MSDKYVSLGWRDAPTATQIVEKLKSFWSELDRAGSVSLRLSSTTAVTAVALEVRDGVPIFLRHNNCTKRAMQPDNMDYWASMLKITTAIKIPWRGSPIAGVTSSARYP